MTDAWDGRPANPERDGWHWLHHAEDLRPCPTPWDADHAAWCSGGMHSPRGVVDLGYRYLGPCLTPAEVAAQRDAAWRAGVGAAAGVAALRGAGFAELARWQPANTAPADGRTFLGALSNDWVVRMWAGPAIANQPKPRYAWWSMECGANVPFEPSHRQTQWSDTTLRLKAWMPLPAPPVAAAEPPR